MATATLCDRNIFTFFTIFLIVTTVNCYIPQKELFDALRNHMKTRQFTQRDDNFEICDRHFNEFLNELPNKWALEVADSWGKIPSGIFYGNLVDFGNFDQCLKINHEISDNDNFEGQHCVATIGLESILGSKEKDEINRFEENLPILPRAMAPPPTVLGLRLGICIPSSCPVDYMSVILEEIAETYMDNASIKIDPRTCTKQHTENIYSGWDIFGMTFFSFILALMISSTIYDLVRIKQNQKPNPNLIAFSIYTNGQKIFRCQKSNSPEVMECLNGIRVFSIVWIVFGHTYFMFLFIPMQNQLVVLSWIKNVYSMILIGATFAVDTFFMISGLLVAWSTLRHLDKSNGKLNIFMMYLHRYLRLTPSLAAIIFFFVTVMKFIGNGPMRNILDEQVENCVNNWPFTIIYVQNYVDSMNLCLVHSWYLSVDMQLFILSPIIIYPLWRWKNKFVGVLPILVLMSVCCTFTTFMIYNAFKVNNKLDVELRMKKTYFTTHTRYGSWMIGILLGYLLHNIKGKNITLPRLIVIGGWSVCCLSIFAIIFAAYPIYQADIPSTLVEISLQESLSRVSWSICLAWIIFACVTGYGGPVDWFLSLPHWQPLTKLSYSLYIVHFPFQMLLASLTKNPIYFSDFDMIHRFWGDFALALMFALVWSLAFESPIVTFEKLIFGSGPKQSTKSQETTTNGQHKV